MQPTVICLCPVRNEAWILDRFLQATSLWADHIIIADQNSTDGSREIAARYPKVRLVENLGQGLDERSRQELLLTAARELPGPRLLIALDADEALTGNFTTSCEWKTLLAASPGTQIFMERGDLYPFCQDIGIYHSPWLFGFHDDGRAHDGIFIHSPRLPHDPHGPKLYLSEIKVLHYQYTDWARMKSKHRRYEIVETLHNPRRGAISIYRQYHHMDPPNPWRMPIPPEWFDDYRRQGIDMTSANIDGRYGTDRDVLEALHQHGTRRFRRQAIWDVDWVGLGRVHGFPHPERFADPRSRFEKRVHQWLAASQDPAAIFKLKNRLISLFLRYVLSGW